LNIVCSVTICTEGGWAAALKCLGQKLNSVSEKKKSFVRSPTENDCSDIILIFPKIYPWVVGESGGGGGGGGVGFDFFFP